MNRTAVVAPSGRPSTRPSRRPSVGLRALFGLLGLAVVLFNVALMLSDRAPGFLRRAFGDVVVGLSDRIDATARVPAEQLPGSDVVVHIAVWATAMALVGLTIWTWRGLMAASLVVLATSAVVEIAQGVYSSTRVVERSDALANAVGVGVGTLVAISAYISWSIVSSLRDPPTRSVGRHR